MSTRPGNDLTGRGRSRIAGEFGRIDSKAAPALTLEAASGLHYSLQTITSGSSSQYAQSDDTMLNIHGGFGDQSISGFSFEMWVKMNQTPANTNGLVHFGADATSSSTMGLDWLTAVSAVFWTFTRATVSNRSLAPVTNPSGVWHHFAGTYDESDSSGATVRLFVDGDNSQAVNGNVATPRSWEVGVPLEVGREIYHATVGGALYPAANYHGLRVWNRQLTSGEVVTLYNGGTPLRTLTAGLLSGLRLYWKLGDSAQERQAASYLSPLAYVAGPPPDQTVVDSSGNGFHGHLLRDGSTGDPFPTYVQDAP